VKINRKYNDKKGPVYKKRNDLVKKIPHFWKTALMNHPTLGVSFNEEDENLLDFLDDVEVEDGDNAFKVTFYFKPNPWFKNTSLWKQYALELENPENGRFHQCSPIQYKEGKHLAEGFFALFFSSEPDISPEEDLNVGEIIRDEIYAEPLSFYEGLSSDELDGDGDGEGEGEGFDNPVEEDDEGEENGEEER